MNHELRTLLFSKSLIKLAVKRVQSLIGSRRIVFIILIGILILTGYLIKAHQPLNPRTLPLTHNIVINIPLILRQFHSLHLQSCSSATFLPVLIEFELCGCTRPSLLKGFTEHLFTASLIWVAIGVGSIWASLLPISASHPSDLSFASFFRVLGVEAGSRWLTEQNYGLTS